MERGDRGLIGTMSTLPGVAEAVSQEGFELSAYRVREVGG